MPKLFSRRIFFSVALTALIFALAGCGPATPEAQVSSIKTVRVVMDNNYPPYVIQNADGELQGILVDEWKLWGERAGVQVEITALPWGQALQRMQAGEFDVIDTIFRTPEREQIFDFTEAYAKINVRIYFKANITGLASAADLKGFRVAAKLGDANVDFLQERGITDLGYYNNYEDILQAAQLGSEAIFVMDEPPALYFLYKYGLQNDFHFSEPLYSGEFHRAVRKGDAALLELVKSGFGRISADEYQRINTHWLGAGQSKVSPQLLFFLGAGVAGAALLILGLFTFNRMLQKRVQTRTLELQDALARLQKSEARFRDALEFFPVPVSIATVDGNILSLNRQFIEMYGYQLEDIPGVTEWMLRAYPEPAYRDFVLKQWSADVALALRENNSTPLREYTVTCKDGSRKEVELIMHPAGNLWVASFNNVTERRQADDALRESEGRLRTITENAPDTILQVDQQGVIHFVNRLVPGLTKERVLGSTIYDWVPVDQHETLMRSFKDAFASGERQEYESFGPGPNGEVRAYSVRVMPVMINGLAHSAIYIATDISERKRAEEELRKSENRFRTLFEHAGVGVAQIDSQTGQFMRINQKYCDIVGYPREELLQMDFQQITYPEDLQADLGNMQRLKAGEIGEFTMEKRYYRKNGQLVWVVLIVSPLWSPGQSPDTHIAVAHDITEQKRTEYALRYSEAEVRKLNTELEERVTERTLQLEQANKELEAFAYSVSHDLRAPVRAIDGFTRIVLEEYASNLDLDAAEYLRRVRSESQRMGQLIDALLSLSRMSRAEMHTEMVDLSALASLVLGELQKYQPDRLVEARVAPGISALGDARLLRVMLENLLGNAWKFTSRREKAVIELGMQQRADEQVYFVRDNGAGFDMAYSGKLFGAFQRLHGVDEFEGTGIGLATVHRIINRHGGRVWAESAVGQGTTFYFTLS